jgi:hypothetical protein
MRNNILRYVGPAEGIYAETDFSFEGRDEGEKSEVSLNPKTLSGPKTP